MAKTSSTEKNDKRIRRSESARAKRLKLRLTIKKKDVSPDEQELAIVKLQKAPRDESQIRVRSRCRFCGRAKGTYRKFGLCRIHLREAAMRGEVPGLKKASW